MFQIAHQKSRIRDWRYSRYASTPTSNFIPSLAASSSFHRLFARCTTTSSTALAAIMSARALTASMKKAKCGLLSRAWCSLTISPDKGFTNVVVESGVSGLVPPVAAVADPLATCQVKRG